MGSTARGKWQKAHLLQERKSSPSTLKHGSPARRPYRITIFFYFPAAVHSGTNSGLQKHLPTGSTLPKEPMNFGDLSSKESAFSGSATDFSSLSNWGFCRDLIKNRKHRLSGMKKGNSK